MLLSVFVVIFFGKILIILFSFNKKISNFFSWPCLHQWFETKPLRPTCPVCKNPISREQVIPLYGRGSGKKDPRDKKIPPRPQGQRSEADYSSVSYFLISKLVQFRDLYYTASIP